MKKIKRVTEDNRVKIANQKLKSLYKKIPNTNGCLENLSKCCSYCCQIQNPQVLYCEFLNSWYNIITTWETEDVIRLFERALRNYLSNNITKGCIFWDENTRLCKQHKTRPYSCMMYGITPDEEFAPRYERLKALYKDRTDVCFREQCNLVKTEHNKKVNIKDTGHWWRCLNEIEQGLGVKKKEINDGPGGSYRTYHDHLLIQLLPENILEQLTQVRLDGDIISKEMAIRNLVDQLKQNIEKGFKGDRVSGNEETKS